MLMITVKCVLIMDYFEIDEIEVFVDITLSKIKRHKKIEYYKEKLKSENNWAERGIQMRATIHKLGTCTVQQHSELTWKLLPW